MIFYVPSSFAGWNDLYFCEMKEWVVIDENGSISYDLESFVFKRQKDYLIMEDYPFFKNLPYDEELYEIRVDIYDGASNGEFFISSLHNISYLDGKFIYASVNTKGQISSIFAECVVLE